MTTSKAKPAKAKKTSALITNDLSMTVATMNGSGSQTSNLTLLRALFKMGIPVSGKNLFPSNIQGLPTWYTIRVNKDGYIGRRGSNEIVVAMNGETFAKDLQDVEAGGAFFYPDHLKFDIEREDISIYSFPAKSIVKDSDAPASLRDYLTNMTYVGVVAQSLEIDLDAIHQALDFHFKGKEKPIKLNMDIIQKSYDWAAENIEKNDPYVVSKMNETGDLIMANGNTAAALGAIYGGVQFASWYPITPASSLVEEMTKRIGALRDSKEVDERTYAIIQSEDELSAIGMAIGAGWSGLRAMTSTSGPGISLMTEFVGLAYYAEIPVVIWDVQRVGPSTGLPTRTAQGDIISTHFLGHGDTQNIMLIPGTVQECFEFGWRAFDVADRYQTPVFVMSDLDLGMNQWMTKPFEYPNQPFDRGKILWEEDLEKIKNKWGRYKDIDKDAITYRTVPGNKAKNSGWFARGTGHNEEAKYSEDNEHWEENMERLSRKFESARSGVPTPIIESRKGAKIGIISYGSTNPALEETIDQLEELGMATDYLRLRAIPFSNEVKEFIETHERIYVVEMNRDGQMHKLLTLDYPQFHEKLIALPKHDGLPLRAAWIRKAIRKVEGK